MLYSPEIALIDGDVVGHRVGFTTENDEFWVAKARCDAMLDTILLSTGVEEYQLWLSGNPKDNFRYNVYPKYKANRTKPKPRHYEGIKEYLVREWGARFTEGYEADDALGINQTESAGIYSTVICSIDKDLKQIPGLHYNFVKEEWDEIDEDRALKEFYKQIIIGDVSDNIPGAYGMGPVKAAKACDGLPNFHGDALEKKLYASVRILYQQSLVKEWDKPWTKGMEAALHGMILLSGRLLKIKRSEGEGLWDFPFSNPMEEFISLYTPLPEVDHDPSTAPIKYPEILKSGFPLAGQPKDDTSAQSSPVG